MVGAAPSGTIAAGGGAPGASPKARSPGPPMPKLRAAKRRYASDCSRVRFLLGRGEPLGKGGGVGADSRGSGRRVVELGHGAGKGDHEPERNDDGHDHADAQPGGPQTATRKRGQSEGVARHRPERSANVTEQAFYCLLHCPAKPNG